MSSRSYLSIGDVLTLLREEFPDVTISKIRFLESQGLVNPERSPSGYRKFFDHDVERLRWVLRQQREHFLPLKVIRDRLADGDLGDPVAEPPNGKQSARQRQPAHAAAAAGTSSGAAGTPSSFPEEHPTKADEEAMARILADASRRAARMPEDPQGRRGLQVVGDPGMPSPNAATASSPASAAATTAAGAAPDVGPADVAEHHPAQAARAARTGPQQSGAGGRSGSSRGAGAGASRAASTASSDGGDTANGVPARGNETAEAARSGSGGQRSPGAAQGGVRKGQAHTPGPAGAPDAPAAPGVAGGEAPAAPAATVTGASLTAEELSSASGLSAEEVAGLVSFGLIDPVVVAGIETYDEDALTLANLAASFRAFGIEPRHLRLYRNAVDREVGLIEQVVIPLLRQRNPESRQRALDAADQLGTLGQAMRATLLKQALRRHLGG